MPSFTEVIDQVGSNKLSSLHEEETEQEISEPEVIERPVRVMETKYVVRKVQNGVACGLVSRQALPLEEALSRRDKFNENQTPNEPIAKLRKIS